MEKIIDETEMEHDLGTILRQVVTQGDEFVVEQHGEQVAVLVPMHVYQQWQQVREHFFATIRLGAERANCTPEEAEALALEAVRAVRAQHQPRESSSTQTSSSAASCLLVE